MAKQAQIAEQPNQVQVNPGNIELLTVKLLADVVQQLKRIADSLEAKK